MRTVEMQLQPHELSGTMAAMRIWLDERRFEPSSFTYNDFGDRVLVRVEFKIAEEANAFARCFGGGVETAHARVIGQAYVGPGRNTDLALERNCRLSRPQTTPSPRKASISAAPRPNHSPSASAVCSPSSGAGLTGATLPSNRTGQVVIAIS